MAAIDPSAEPQIDEDYKIPRATLKVVRVPVGSDDDDGEDEDDEDYDEHDVDSIRKTLQGIISDEDVDMSDEDEGDDSEGEKKGGPSDPAKAKKMKQEALSKKLKEELDSLADDSLTNGVNGKSKGKAKAVDGVDSDDDSEIESDDEVEEFVLCTLDPEKVGYPLTSTDMIC
jgi:FK506-binding nuclear protein